MLDIKLQPRTILGFKTDNIYDNLHTLHEVMKERAKMVNEESLPIRVIVLTERPTGFIVEALFDEFCADTKTLNYDPERIVPLLQKAFDELKCNVSLISRETFDHGYIGEEDFTAIPMELGFHFKQTNLIYFCDIPLDMGESHRAATHGHLQRTTYIRRTIEQTALDNTIIMTRLHDDVHVRAALAELFDDYV